MPPSGSASAVLPGDHESTMPATPVERLHRFRHFVWHVAVLRQIVAAVVRLNLAHVFGLADNQPQIGQRLVVLQILGGIVRVL